MHSNRCNLPLLQLSADALRCDRAGVTKRLSAAAHDVTRGRFSVTKARLGRKYNRAYFSAERRRRRSLATWKHERTNAVAAVARQLVRGAAAAAGVRSAATEQTEALPHHSADVWVRHIAGNWGTGPWPRLGTGGESFQSLLIL